MLDSGPLAAVGWLIFVMGVAIALVATVSKGARLKSAGRRVADMLTGVVLCLVALTLIVAGGRAVTYSLLAAAVLAMFGSWYIGRHARQFDRAAKKARRAS